MIVCKVGNCEKRGRGRGPQISFLLHPLLLRHKNAECPLYPLEIKLKHQIDTVSKINVEERLCRLCFVLEYIVFAVCNNTSPSQLLPFNLGSCLYNSSMPLELLADQLRYPYPSKAINSSKYKSFRFQDITACIFGEEEMGVI